MIHEITFDLVLGCFLGTTACLLAQPLPIESGAGTLELRWMTPSLAQGLSSPVHIQPSVHSPRRLLTIRSRHGRIPKQHKSPAPSRGYRSSPCPAEHFPQIKLGLDFRRAEMRGTPAISRDGVKGFRRTGVARLAASHSASLRNHRTNLIDETANHPATLLDLCRRTRRDTPSRQEQDRSESFWLMEISKDLMYHPQLMITPDTPVWGPEREVPLTGCSFMKGFHCDAVDCSQYA